MFCEKCGTQLPDDAKFCTNCGTSTEKTITNEKIIDDEVQFRVKPTFKFWYMALPKIICFTILILIYSGLLMLINFNVGTAFSIIGFAILVIGIGIKATLNKKQYDNYTYDFYKTKVIYRDNFMNLAEKEIKYKYIREVNMKQTFMQRQFNIGVIVLYTNAETGLGSGIYLFNIENVKDVYKQIKEIINL